MKCDISKFFASISQSRLKEKLKKKIKDRDALNIVFKIIDSDNMGLGIRKYDKSNIGNILLKWYGSLYKRKIKNKILCAISRRCDPFLSEKLRH